MKIKSSILLAMITISAFAQDVPGYMGKRFSIGYSNYFMLAPLGPTANSTDVGINTVNSFNIEYSIKRRTNFCLSVQTGKTGIDPGTFNVMGYDMYNDYTTYSYSYNINHEGPMQLRTTNVGLGFKFFQKGTLAPIGKYKKLELLLIFDHLTYKKSAFTSDESGGTSTSIGTGDYNFSTFGITYTMGRSRVLFDKLVLDYGLRIGFVPSGIWAYLNQDGDFTSSSLDTESRLKYDINQRLFRSQLFNLHIGLSFLAF